jgi:excisionase family DNA binding protein
MSIKTTEVIDSPKLYTADGLAQYLGVPLGTVNRWNYTGTGPRAVRVGRFVRYRPADVERWLEDNAKPAR